MRDVKPSGTVRRPRGLRRQKATFTPRLEGQRVKVIFLEPRNWGHLADTGTTTSLLREPAAVTQCYLLKELSGGGSSSCFSFPLLRSPPSGRMNPGSLGNATCSVSPSLRLLIHTTHLAGCRTEQREGKNGS